MPNLIPSNNRIEKAYVNLRTMLFRRKTRRTIADLDKFFEITDQSLLVFEEGVKSYLYHDEGRFLSSLKSITTLDEDSNNFRRQIETSIYSQPALSGLSGDILKLLERLNHIIYTMSNDMFQFEVEKPYIPVELRADYLKLLELSVKAASDAIPAARAIFRSPDEVQDTIHRIYFYQREANRQSKELKRKVFQEMENLKLSEKFHLRYFALHIEDLSSAAMKLADHLSIMSVRRY